MICVVCADGFTRENEFMNSWHTLWEGKYVQVWICDGCVDPEECDDL